METLTIPKQKVLSEYHSADDKTKKILTAIFGEETFSVNLLSAKTFEDVCSIMAVNPDDIIPYKSPVNTFQKGINAFAVLTFIADAFNGDWKADWDNTNQKKWYPYFEKQSSGFRFYFSSYGYYYADTIVGSRLCYKDEETATHVGKIFISHYNELLIK